MEKKIEVGQKLWDCQLKEFEVSKIGSTYFECAGMRGRFFIETLKQDSQFCPFHLNINREVVLVNIQRAKLFDTLRKSFEWHQKNEFSLQQLITATEALGIEQKLTDK